MDILKGILSFIKCIFNKKQEIKLLEPAKIENQHKGREIFAKSLMVKELNEKKRRIETLICYGDGLGIQNELKS